MATIKISSGKAEAGGYRAYVTSANNRIIKSKWFKTEKQAKAQATAWKRIYR